MREGCFHVILCDCHVGIKDYTRDGSTIEQVDHLAHAPSRRGNRGMPSSANYGAIIDARQDGLVVVHRGQWPCPIIRFCSVHHTNGRQEYRQAPIMSGYALMAPSNAV